QRGRLPVPVPQGQRAVRGELCRTGGQIYGSARSDAAQTLDPAEAGRERSMSDEIAKLRAEIAELEKRVRTNEDYRAIANLQAAYGYYVDKGLWDKAADVFAGDGTLEIAGRGVYKGKERVRAYLHRLPADGQGTLFNHMQLQPVLHIDSEGGTAKA